MARKKANQVQADENIEQVDSVENLLPRDISFLRACKRGFLEFLTDNRHAARRWELRDAFLKIGFWGGVIGAACTQNYPMGWVVFGGTFATALIAPVPVAACIRGLKRGFAFLKQKEDFKAAQNYEQVVAELAEEKARNRQLEADVQKLRKSMEDEDRGKAIEAAYQDGYYQAVSDIKNNQHELSISTQQQGTRFAARESVVAEGGQGVSRKTKFTLG